MPNILQDLWKAFPVFIACLMGTIVFVLGARSREKQEKSGLYALIHEPSLQASIPLIIAFGAGLVALITNLLVLPGPTASLLPQVAGTLGPSTGTVIVMQIAPLHGLALSATPTLIVTPSSSATSTTTLTEITTPLSAVTPTQIVTPTSTINPTQSPLQHQSC